MLRYNWFLIRIISGKIIKTEEMCITYLEIDYDVKVPNKEGM